MVWLLVCVIVWAGGALHAAPVYATSDAVRNAAPAVGQIGTRQIAMRQIAMRQIGAPSIYDTPEEESASTDTLRLDEQRVEVRAPSDERMAAYENDDAYNYERDDPPDEGAGILEWLLSQIIDLLQSSETSRTITEIVIYVLIAIALGYGILAVIRMEPRSKRRSSTTGYRADGLEERVQDTDFEPLIDQAVQDGDYRGAIRLMYLHGLQKLDRSGHIDWAPDRTNRQYAHDLSGTDLQQPFREATRIFDIVWYGDNDVSESDLQRLRPPFDEIRKQADASPPGTSDDSSGPSSSGPSSPASSSSAKAGGAGE